MFDFIGYENWTNSLPEPLCFWVDKLTMGHTEAQIELILAHNNLLVDLFNLLGDTQEFDYPDLLLQNLGTMVVDPSLSPLKSTLESDYKAYCKLQKAYRDSLPVVPLSKSEAIGKWFTICDNWGSTLVDGQWVTLSDEAVDAKLVELENRTKEDWLKESPSPELEAILAHFESGKCPNCNSAKGSLKFKCKDCNTNFTTP
jgi:hypothetical protein